MRFFNPILIACLLIISPNLHAQEIDEETKARNKLSSRAQSTFMLDAFINTRKEKGWQYAEQAELFHHAHDLSNRTPSGINELYHLYSGINSVPLPSLDNSDEWDHRLKALDGWIAFSPSDPDPYVIKAINYLNLAIAMRRDGYARAGIDQLIDKAEQYLKQNKDIASKSPYWYVVMMQCSSLRHDRDETIARFEQGIAAYPDNSAMYFNAIGYMYEYRDTLIDDIEYIARRAVELTHEKEGMSMYARVYWSASGWYGRDFMTNPNVNWDDIKMGMRDILNLYPSKWNAQFFAFQACTRYDFKMMEEMFSHVDLPYIRQPWYRVAEIRQCKFMLDFTKENKPELMQ